MKTKSGLIARGIVLLVLLVLHTQKASAQEHFDPRSIEHNRIQTFVNEFQSGLVDPTKIKRVLVFYETSQIKNENGRNHPQLTIWACPEVLPEIDAKYFPETEGAYLYWKTYVPEYLELDIATAFSVVEFFALSNITYEKTFWLGKSDEMAFSWENPSWSWSRCDERSKDIEEVNPIDQQDDEEHRQQYQEGDLEVFRKAVEEMEIDWDEEPVEVPEPQRGRETLGVPINFETSTNMMVGIILAGLLILGLYALLRVRFG